MLLPIHDHIEIIQSQLEQKQVLIVAGETGSGKSTQLPQLCYRLGLTKTGRIGHTQPRRLAARSIASRVAEEMQVEVGGLVGYQVRFDERISQETAIKLMTDGVLLQEMQHDPLLKQYSVLIIDEAHERSLNIDFILGYLKQLLIKRQDLRVIITSATLDHQRFSEHFGGAPIVEVSGRAYPVEIRYQPLELKGQVCDTLSGVRIAIDQILESHQAGDVLIFLPTERDIHEHIKQLAKCPWRDVELLPLYGRLSASQQQRIFRQSQRRKLIFATNVAETSVTVPGVVFVIDSGWVRMSRYHYRTKVQRLPIEPISQASANQRAGRCGRVAPGLCIRLYTLEDYQSRREYTEPEILRTNLASVILQMHQLKLGDIEKFPFLDKPDPRWVKDGYRLLHELGVCSPQKHFTPMAKQISRLSIEPRYARMLIAAKSLGCLPEVLIVVCGLSLVDPRERPLESQQAADRAHQRYQDKRSDFISLLNVWKTFQRETAGLSQNKTRRYCQQSYLSYMRMREWQDLVLQIRQQAQDLLQIKINLKTTSDDMGQVQYAQVHRALLSGLLSHIATHHEAFEYLGARHTKWYIFPGSGLFQHSPKWIVAAEIIETQKRYGRYCAKIDSTWLEPLAKHLLKRHYSEPHWQASIGQVGGYERVSLYGLDIVPKRRVNFGPIDPVISRELFIRHALVAGEFKTDIQLIRQNQQLIKTLEELEHRARRRDILIDDQTLFGFYDALLPERIYSAPTFHRWWKGLTIDERQQFALTKDQLLRLQHEAVDDQDFPMQLYVSGWLLPLRYSFAPGAKDDGITVQVPLTLLNQLPTEPFDWLVPGLLHEKIAVLIKALPKAKRVRLAPVQETAKRVLSLMQDYAHTDCFYTALAVELTKLAGLPISSDEWSGVILPAHLFFRVQLLDQNSDVLAESRDIEVLQSEWSESISDIVESVDTQWQQAGLTGWPEISALPEQVMVKQQGVEYSAYLVLIDQGDCVDIRLEQDLRNAEQLYQQGLVKLIWLGIKDRMVSLCKRNSDLQALVAIVKDRLSPRQCYQDLGLHYVGCLLNVESAWQIRSLDSYQACIERLKAGIEAFLSERAGCFCLIGTHYGEINKLLKKRSLTPVQLMVFPFIKSRVQHLIAPKVWSRMKPENFYRLPLYLKALLKLADRLNYGAAKVREIQLIVEPLFESYFELPVYSDASYFGTRWLLEEFALSLICQDIKPLAPVSAKKLQVLIQDLASRDC